MHVFAGALVAVATNDTELRNRVVQGLTGAVGTENGARALAIARQLTGYVLAADIIGYYDPSYVQWVGSMITFPTTSGPGSLRESHMERPNNWGTHAGVARLAAALYTNDGEEAQDAVDVFVGFLGDRSRYAGFKYGDLSWQANPEAPVGVNPPGSSLDGHSLDGALPEELRRAGGFQYPFPKENYCWEAMQGIVTMAWLVEQNGFFVLNLTAVKRAYDWLVNEADYPAEGDDRFVVPMIECLFDPDWPGVSTNGAVGSGKSIGFTGWTHGFNTGVEEPPVEEPPVEEPPVEEPPAEEPPAEEPPAEEPPAPLVVRHHVVEPGDTLWGIALEYDVTVTDLRVANNIAPNDDLILVGRVLHVVT